MGSLLELDEFETSRRPPVTVARRVPTQWPPVGTPTVTRHPRLGYGQRYPPPRRGRPQRELESEVLGADTRGFVKDTTEIPHRFICWLALIFLDPVSGAPTTFRGTGTLISPRHVLTAGHNLFDDINGTRVAVNEVRVGPGFNCLEKRGDILGIATSRATAVAARWNAALDNNFDYGVITLQTPIGSSRPAALGGAQLGWWGSKDLGGDTRINPVTLARLRGLGVGVSGYPGDKCCVRGADPASLCRTPGEMSSPCREILWATSQFRAFGRITDPSPAAGPQQLFYSADTCGGHSGSPVWVTWRDDASGKTYRNMVGIHTGAGPTAAGGRTNRAVRITDAVMTEVRTLMR
jgi:V8-like Glu-specific endopeptidase